MTLSVAYLIVTQFLIGFGVLARLRPVTKGLSLLGLSMLAGLGISSVLPFVLQFAHAPIARFPMFIGLGLLAALSLLLLRGQFTYLRDVFARKQFMVHLYELPFLGFWAYLLFISAWKCAWYPNLPFDTIVGPDLIATFAVRERTLISSVFTAHLPSVSVFSNQPFYAPFTAMQQILYLLAAGGIGTFAFGKLWLTVMVLAFGLFFYADMRERIHPLLAGLLVTMLACSPELFAYTFLVQTDWANAAFFVVGVMLLQRYFDDSQRSTLLAATLFFAFACWIRTETILFVFIGSALLFAKSLRSSPGKAVLKASMLTVACLLPFIFWNYIFLRGYVVLPASTHLGTLQTVSGNYFTNLFTIYGKMTDTVLLHDTYWNYSVWAFLAFTTLNFSFFRSKQGLPILIWILGIYGLFGLLIMHIEGANVPFTFRRGFFKILFLMYFYLGYTTLFQRITNWLFQWEEKTLSQASINL
ncbi:hypothetical protein IC229_30400 [Spirosoma sp. BT702]|uniref:Uncharacterized protein n=1 Tax=Spirosoma profusum TaxID=2771354 RepID=A0A927GA67_9BACT|nr:hypothetical protein [Spirosoma profusum]MBD2704979.1 hypothetical protein [Spirosoma profusum]